jgi:Tfp pilus assembly protein PilZ
VVESDERRRGERIPINQEFGRGPGETWVSDLSLGGVFVHTDAILPVGSLIELRFTILLDDPVVIEAFGKVVRHSHKPHGMGVQFAAMQPEMSERIEEVLAHQQPLDSGAPLRLPEPTRESKPAAREPGEDEETMTRVLARPAPVEGLDLRRVQEHEFEAAVTASFPRLTPAEQQIDPKTAVFKPPPAKPKSPPRPPSKPEARAPSEDERTAVFPSVRHKTKPD